MREMLSIQNETKGKLKRLPFCRLKDAVLGKRYELSLTFVKSSTSQKLNRLYRDKNAPANVLSFPLAPREGEIFIDPKEALLDAPKFGMTHKKFIGLLFIHALLHLKGFAHGSKMERTEAKLMKRFKL